MAQADEVRRTVRLPRELMDRVKAAAGSERRSVNAQMVVLIEDALAQRQPPVGKKGSR
jgi:hypothetical protein